MVRGFVFPNNKPGISESFDFTQLSSAEHRTVTFVPSVPKASVPDPGHTGRGSPGSPGFRCYLVGEAPPCGGSAHCPQGLQEAALNPFILESPMRKMCPAFQSTVMRNGLTQCTTGCWEISFFTVRLWKDEGSFPWRDWLSGV